MDYEQLRKAVQEFFADTSRSASETHDALCGLRDEIAGLIECLEDDMKEDK